MPHSLSEGLYVPGATVVHRLPPHVKLLAAVTFVVAVVATPRDQMWAFALHAVVLAGAVAAARLPPALVLRRTLIELPFVVFALLLPFVAEGPRVDLAVGPWSVSVSVDGLVGAVGLLATGTLGVVTAVVLSATTLPRDLVVGLHTIRVPALLVAVLSFMIRYVDIVVDDMRRMRIARESRGFRARHLGHAPVLGRAAGALFVRAYERGERVHRAMLARGYSGSLPAPQRAPTPPVDWLVAATVPVLAAVITLSTVVVGDAGNVSRLWPPAP